LPGNSVTEEVRKKYNEVNEDFRQPFGENAAYALGSFLTAKADDEGIVARGVLGKIIIDKLIKDTSDFRTLNKKINNIKELSIKRGYIKP
ncbi:MAG: hypothetical protein ACK5FG_02780, partial [Chryseotalea sp.]